MPRQPSVPRVSLLSQASTLPPRVTPRVAAIIREAVVLWAPPLRLTTAMLRGPSSGRRMRSRRSLSARSTLPGCGEMTPPVTLVMNPRRPRVALIFSGFAVELCRSCRVGRPSAPGVATRVRVDGFGAGGELLAERSGPAAVHSGCGAAAADGGEVDGADGADADGGADEADPDDAADPAEPAELAELAEPAEPAALAEPAEPAEPVEPADAAEGTGAEGESAGACPAEPAEAEEGAEAAEPPGRVEVAGRVEGGIAAARRRRALGRTVASSPVAGVSTAGCSPVVVLEVRRAPWSMPLRSAVSSVGGAIRGSSSAGAYSGR